MFLPRPLLRTRQMVLGIFLAFMAGGPASAIEMRTGNLVVADRSADPLAFGDYRGSVLVIDEDSQAPVQLVATPDGFRDPTAIGLLADGRVLVVDMNADFLEDRENRGVVWVIDPTVGIPGRADPFAWSEEWVNPVDILPEAEGHVLVLDSDADPLNRGTRPGALFRVRHPTHQVDAVASSAFWSKPVSMVYDIDGSILVWDSRADPLQYGTYPGALFRVNPATGIVELVFSLQAFVTPTAVAVDADGNYLILDRDANPEGYTGAPGGVFRVDREELTIEPYLFLADFVDPADLLVDPSGDLWILDQRANPCGFFSAHGAAFRCDPQTGTIKKTMCSGFFRDLSGMSQFAGSALDSSLVSWEDLSGPPLQPGDRMRVRVLARNTGNVPGRPIVMDHRLGRDWDLRIGSDSVSHGTFSYDPAFRTVRWSGDLEVQGEALITYEIRLDDDVENGEVLHEEFILRIAQVGSSFHLEATVASRYDLDRFVWADYRPGVGTTRGRILTMDPGSIYPTVIFEGDPLVLPDDLVMLPDGTIAVLDRRSRPLGPDQPQGGIYRIDPLDGTIDTLFAVGEHPELVYPTGLANGRVGELLLVDKDANPFGLPGLPGAVYSIDIETGTLEAIASDSLFREPSDVILETTGNLLLVDYNADPYGVGGLWGEGALFEIDRSSGAVDLVNVPQGTFVDPIGLAEGPSRRVYVVDISADPSGIGGDTGAIFEVLRRANDHVLVGSADALYVDPTDVFVTSDGQLVVSDRDGNPFGMPRDWGAIYRAYPRDPPEIVTADQVLYGPEAIAGILHGDLSTSSLTVTDLNGEPSQWGDTLRFEAVLQNSGRAAVGEAMATIFVGEKLTIVDFEGPGEPVAEPETGTAFWFGPIGISETIRLKLDAQLMGDFDFGEEARATLTVSGPGGGSDRIVGMPVVAPLGTGDMVLVDINADPNHLGHGDGALFLIREEDGEVEQVLYTDPIWIDPTAVEGLDSGRLLVADKQGLDPGVIFAVDYMMGTTEVYLEDPRLGSPSDLLWTRNRDLLIVDPFALLRPPDTDPAIFIRRAGEEELTIFCADTLLQMPVHIAEDDQDRLWLIDRRADPNGSDEGRGALFLLDRETGAIVGEWQTPGFEAPVAVVPWTGEGLLIVDEVSRADPVGGTGVIFLFDPEKETFEIKISDPLFRQPHSAALSPGDKLWIVDRIARNEALPGNPRTLFCWDPGTGSVDRVAASSDYTTVGEIYAFPGPLPRITYYECEDINGPPLNPDDVLQFRVKIENIGLLGTKQASFSDTLPVQVQLDETSVRASGGIVEFYGRVNGLYWTMDLAAEGSAELSYRARVHRGTQQGKEFKFESHLVTREGVHRVGRAKVRLYVYYEDGHLYIADKDADPYELGGHPGAVWKVLLSNGVAEPMISSPDFRGPVQVLRMPTEQPQLLIVDSEANPRGYVRGRGCIWGWDPETGDLQLAAADSAFRSPCCAVPINGREVLVLDTMADPFGLTQGVGPGAVFLADIESGDVEPFASDTILSVPVSMILDGNGGLFVLDREADPNRYGLRNGAIFRLDLAQRTFSVYSTSADFRGPVCAVAAPDGFLYVLDRDVSYFPGSEAHGAIYRVDEMGNASLVIASRQFRRPSGFCIDPLGQMIVSDPYADPRDRGTDTGAIFRRVNLENEFRIFSAPAAYVNPYGFFVRDDLTPTQITDLEAVAAEEGIRIAWRVGAAQFEGFFCMRAGGVDPEWEDYQILNPDDPVPGRGPWEYIDRSVESSETYTYQILGLLPGGIQRFYGPVVATASACCSFALLPPTPNPVHGATNISFDLPAEGETDLEVYDLQGRRIRSLAEGRMQAGRHAILWDGRNDRGHPVASGIYLVRLAWKDRTQTGRIVFLR